MKFTSIHKRGRHAAKIPGRKLIGPVRTEIDLIRLLNRAGYRIEEFSHTSITAFDNDEVILYTWVKQ